MQRWWGGGDKAALLVSDTDVPARAPHHSDLRGQVGCRQHRSSRDVLRSKRCHRDTGGGGHGRGGEGRACLTVTAKPSAAGNAVQSRATLHTLTHTHTRARARVRAHPHCNMAATATAGLVVRIGGATGMRQFAASRVHCSSTAGKTMWQREKSYVLCCVQHSAAGFSPLVARAEALLPPPHTAGGSCCPAPACEHDAHLAS